MVGPELSTGDGFQLVCVDANQGALAFGAACSPDPGAGDALRGRFAVHHGAEFSAEPVLLARCAATTPTARRTRAASSVQTRVALAGRPAPGDRDVHAGIEDHRQGVRARGRLRRRPGLRHLRRAHRACASAARAATKSLGTACAAAAECRSGECFDRDWHVRGGQNRAYCSGACNVNSDCGADQRCARLVVGNNGTGERSARRPGVGLLPDAVRRRSPAPACASDADCVALQNGSDGCDVDARPLLSRRRPRPASACTTETDCPLGGECSIGPALPRRLLPDVRLRRRRRRRA